jgi:hypothetical protein
LEALQTSVQKVGEAVYSQQGGPDEGPPPEGQAPDEPPEDTVEGEFREV